MKPKLTWLAAAKLRANTSPMSLSLAAALLSGTALLAPVSALAQTAPADTTVLDELTVRGELNAEGPDDSIVANSTATATKTDEEIRDVPQSISVVTAEELETRGVRTLDGALNYTSGVSTDIYGSDDRSDFFQIRGFYQSATGYYRDGLAMPVESFTGTRMEPYGVQRVEVLKGSTSTLFGMNNPGGLVNAITKRPQFEDFGEIYTSVGDGHIETGTDFGGILDEQGEWAYRLTGKWQDGDTGPDYTEDDRYYGAGALTWSPSSDTSLTLMANYNKRNSTTAHGIPYGSGIDPETYLGEPDFDRFDTEEFNLGYDFSHNFGNGFEFRQNARYTNINLDYESVFAPGVGTDIATQRSTLAVYGDSERYAIDNQLQYDASFGRIDSRTLVGLDASYTDLDETRYDSTIAGIDINNPVYCGRGCVVPVAPSLTQSDTTAVGIYADEELTLDDTWILSLGGRFDSVRNETPTTDYTDEAFTGKIGLTNRLTDEISIYGNYAQSFMPVFGYYSLIPGAHDPQRGEQYEVGVKYQPFGTNALFTAAAYSLTQTNVPRYNAGGAIYEQIGEVNVKGIELEGKWALTDRANITLAYAYQDAEIKDGASSGNAPQLVPAHTASLWADYTFPGEGRIGDITLGAGVRLVGERYADDANTLKLDGHAVFDAALNYQISEDASLSLNVNNVFDQEYVSHVDTYSNTAYYGDGRSVLATLKYSW